MLQCSVTFRYVNIITPGGQENSRVSVSSNNCCILSKVLYLLLYLLSELVTRSPLPVPASLAASYSAPARLVRVSMVEFEEILSWSLSVMSP